MSLPLDCHMNNTRTEENSYSYLEWRLSVSAYSGPLSFWHEKILTKNGQRFSSLETKIGYLEMLFCVVVLMAVSGIFTIFVAPSVPPIFHGFIGAALIIFCMLLFLITNYLFFPIVGKIAFNRGYIDESELQIILNGRVPKSIFLSGTAPIVSEKNVIERIE